MPFFLRDGATGLKRRPGLKKFSEGSGLVRIEPGFLDPDELFLDRGPVGCRALVGDAADVEAAVAAGDDMVDLEVLAVAIAALNKDPEFRPLEERSPFLLLPASGDAPVLFKVFEKVFPERRMERLVRTSQREGFEREPEQKSLRPGSNLG